ncbi:MAG: methyltransferase domain-containing protein [Phycisphaeraceae bacterium]
MKMKESVTSKTYDLWAWFYDYTFGALVANRQVRAVQQLPLRPGDRVLDLGVGTGMLLPHYRRDVKIVGIDLSAGMLAKAENRRVAAKMEHVQLVQGDAMLPPFAEQSFDHIIVTHVISVVSDPDRLLNWASRLLRPGGRIVILNHFQSDIPIVAWFERVLNPIFVKIGWRSDLALEEVLRGANVNVEYTFKMGVIDLWRIVVLTHRNAGTQSTHATGDSAPGLARTRLTRNRLAVEGH